MKKFLLCLSLISCCIYPHWFSYDTAIAQAQKGDWQQSKETLKALVVEKSEQPELLYDTGVASFKTEEYDKALAYFTKAAAADNAILQEQAYFNQGNTLVKLNRLPAAIEAYDRVLDLNSDHEKAAHNKEVVKKMLEQQKKQQEQKDQQEKKDKKEENNDKNQQQQKNKSDSSQKQEDKENQEHEKEAEKNNGDRDTKQEQGNQQEEKKSAGNDKRSSEKKESASDKKNAGNQPEQQADAEEKKQEEQLSPMMAHFLKEQEKRDAKMNKQMVKAMVGQGGSRNDTHNW